MLARSHLIVEKIYQLAKDKNKKALTELLNEGSIAVGVQSGSDNAIIRLAREGDVDSVNFLIDEFAASLNDATLGYASGGHVLAAITLRQAGVSHYSFINGLAQAGVPDLIHLWQPTPQYMFFRQVVIDGYARGGHFETVKNLRENGLNNFFVLSSYAESGFIEEVNKAFDHNNDLYWAIEGYARGGYVDEVNKLLATDKPNVLGVAVRFYAIGGHVEQVNDLLERGASIDQAVMGYAEGDHIVQVNQLIAKGASRAKAAMFYIGFIKFDNIIPVLRIMAHTDDEELRNAIAAEALKKMLITDTEIETLKAKATAMNCCMRLCGFTHNQAALFLIIEGMLFSSILSHDFDVVKCLRVCEARGLVAARSRLFSADYSSSPQGPASAQSSSQLPATSYSLPTRPTGDEVVTSEAEDDADRSMHNTANSAPRNSPKR